MFEVFCTSFTNLIHTARKRTSRSSLGTINASIHGPDATTHSGWFDAFQPDSGLTIGTCGLTSDRSDG